MAVGSRVRPDQQAAPGSGRTGARQAALASRPPLLRAVNAAGAVLSRAGATPSLQAGALVAAARRRTGLTDLGSTEYEAPLEVLLRSLEEDGRLNAVGRLAARSQVLTLLTNRLQLQDWWTRHPEMLQEPVSRPWFVVGLPRTGTTLLQNLLAADPDNRSLLYWEATSPAPPPGPATSPADPRIRRARRAQRVLDRLAPLANELHPVGAEAPTECVTLLANSFASLEFGAINRVPAHVRWCLETDMRPHYRYLRRQLQLLQWRHRRVRWTLKSPAHLFALDALLDVFPDARIVWLHREPVTAVTSHCSLTTVLRGLGTDHPDPQAVGREWPPVWVHAVGRALQTRDRHGDGPFLDVAYRDLVADPLGTVGRIYDWAGGTLDEGARQAMTGFLDGQQAHGRTVHAYRPEDFGIDPVALGADFGGYRSRYGPLVA